MLTLLPLFLVKLHLNHHLGMIGLSFMTFRAVDVLLYRSKKEGQNFLHYFCYLFMPFIILAGPMYRWRTWMNDVSKPVFALNGAGRLFGLNIPANFNMPLLAKNPQDFWRRFHISLSEWLRDVVFMPVYMNLMKFNFFRQNKTLAQNIGIFCTLFCMGAWNGLERHYVISGALFGAISVAHNMLLWSAKRSPALHRGLQYPAVAFLGRILTLGSAAGALYIFRNCRISCVRHYAIPPPRSSWPSAAATKP